MKRKTLGELRDEQVAEAYEAGRAAERADVIAKLLTTAGGCAPTSWGRFAAETLRSVAQHIERGDHVPPGTPPADDPNRTA